MTTGYGGAIYATAAATLSVADSVFWMNRASTSGDDVYSSQPASVTYSCMQTSGWGAGTIQLTGSPFASFGNSTLSRLVPTSACIDAGSNAAVALDLLDLDRDGNTTEPTPVDRAGKPRFVEHPMPNTGSGTPPLVDMGAYEKPN